MKSLEEVKAHCRFVGEGIEKSVADGEDLFARFEGTPVFGSRWSAKAPDRARSRRLARR